MIPIVLLIDSGLIQAHDARRSALDRATPALLLPSPGCQPHVSDNEQQQDQGSGQFPDTVDSRKGCDNNGRQPQ